MGSTGVNTGTPSPRPGHSSDDGRGGRSLFGVREYVSSVRLLRAKTNFCEARHFVRGHAAGHPRKWLASNLFEERQEEMHQEECRVDIRRHEERGSSLDDGKQLPRDQQGAASGAHPGRHSAAGSSNCTVPQAAASSSSFGSRPIPKPQPTKATTKVHHSTVDIHTTVANVMWTAADVNDVAIPSHDAGPSGVTTNGTA